jgi:hypothetical protein
MSDIASSDALQQLDERHELLLAELDLLNRRLEAILATHGKPVAAGEATELPQ